MPKDNKNNKKYSNEEKEAILNKLIKTTDIKKLSKEIDVPESTLRTWKKKEINNGENIKIDKDKIKSKDKFHIVMETYTYSEYELSKYCREKGLYVEDIRNWRKSFEGSLDSNKKEVKEVKEELSEEKKKIKNLEKELRRKEKALAEAAALLVLQKKFQAFMEEEDN